MSTNWSGCGRLAASDNLYPRPLAVGTIMWTAADVIHRTFRRCHEARMPTRDSDITPITSATLALWGLCSTEVAARPKKRSGKACFA
jgi:hypothetical protein